MQNQKYIQLMKTNLQAYQGLALLFWIAIIFLSMLLAHNAALYFTHGGEYGIMPEKAYARKDLAWLVCFYLHLPFGVICLLAPILLLTKNVFPTGVKFHRLLGKAYVYTTIAIVCPTGIYLALYAKGGLITQMGFLVQAILLGLFTWLGLKAVINGNIGLHRRMMIRSYATGAVVLTFRLLHLVFFLFDVPYQDNYALSQWLGITGNALTAELFIFITSINSFKHKIIHL
jgi:uncharacterized membrane protein